MGVPVIDSKGDAMPLTRDQFESIYNEEGKAQFFSIEEFAKRIAGDENCCFVCGEKRDIKNFNNEHIISDWILSKFNLHSRRITLPNMTGFSYGSYVIPCCEECNSLMENIFETPISRAFNEGYSGIVNYIQEDNFNSTKIFVWLCLIFTKTHLKDATLILERDRRISDGSPISDIYGMKSLHHVYCLARSFFTNAKFSPPNMGSLICLPAKVSEDFELFDYIDWVDTKTILLRIDDIAIISVLNDCCAVLGKITPILDRIQGALSPVQLREIFAHFSYCSTLLENSPTFRSQVTDSGHVIKANLDEAPIFQDFNNEDYGTYLHSACYDLIKNSPNYNEIEEVVKSGNLSFITDENGSFIEDSIIRGN